MKVRSHIRDLQAAKMRRNAASRSTPDKLNRLGLAPGAAE
jgi:hypothetical protein